MECPLYKKYRAKVEVLRKGVIAESTSRKEDASDRKRKSRWGDENDKVALNQPGSVPQINSNRNPQLIQYAIKVFGSTDLEESQWKQCEDQLKVSLFFGMDIGVEPRFEARNSRNAFLKMRTTKERSRNDWKTE